MKRNNYITIQGFMQTDLGLVGNELVAYAIIYGFSQDGTSVFSGSARYLADTMGITKRAVFSVLQRLVQKGCIIRMPKQVNGVLLIDYKANLDLLASKQTLPPAKKVHRWKQSSLGGSEESMSGGSEETYLHKDNIDKDNIDNNSLSYLSQPVSDENGVEPTGQESFSDGAVIDGWNSIAERYKLSKIQKLTSNRRKKLESRLKDTGMSLTELLDMISDKIRKSSFLRGKKLAYDGNGQWRIENADWFCDFDFFLQPSSLQKVMEDRYTDKTYLENPLEQKIISPDS